MNQRGQALIEAIAGAGLIATLIAGFFLTVLIAATQLILDEEADKLTLCLAERNANCLSNTKEKLKQQAPWLESEHASGFFSIGASGYGTAKATIQAKTKMNFIKFNEKGFLTWKPLKFIIVREFREEDMKRVLR